MDTFKFVHASKKRLKRMNRLPGVNESAIVGVVASGNLEVLVERIPDEGMCEILITTPVTGFGALWQAVVADFVERYPTGGARFSINDCGARPDTVMLRLMQAAAALGGPPNLSLRARPPEGVRKLGRPGVFSGGEA